MNEGVSFYFYVFSIWLFWRLKSRVSCFIVFFTGGIRVGDGFWRSRKRENFEKRGNWGV